MSTTYSTNPFSRIQIRQYANLIREKFYPNGELFFPVVHFLEVLHLIIRDDDFHFEVVDDDCFPASIHAIFFPEYNCLRIKCSVYEGAQQGNGRDRMTIAHEIGHVLLHKHSCTQLTRSFSQGIPAFMDPEWQAKAFAGELLIPFGRISGMAAEDVAIKCGVSLDAARYQLRFQRKSGQAQSPTA